jgi:hypothetical protein
VAPAHLIDSFRANTNPGETMRRINDDKRSTKRSDGDQRTPGASGKLTLQRQTLRELSLPNLEIAQGGLGCSISQDNDI